MEKSILLEQRNKTLWILLAVLFCVNGVMHLINEQLPLYRMILGILMILLSIIYATYSFLGFSVNSKYAAKLRITDQLIELKSSFWKPLVKLNWDDVKNIQLDNFKVIFELTSGTKSISYNTSAERSRQLKQLLKETAEQRNIQVIGG